MQIPRWKPDRIMEELSIDPVSIASQIEDFIRREVERLRREGVILGLSGGLDSAVVAALAARALDPETVLALIMPELDSARESKGDALGLARMLGMRWKTIGLTKMLLPIGIYGRVPLWLLGLRRLKERMVRRYYEGFSEELGEYETPFAAIMVGTKGLRGPWLNQAMAYHRVKVRLRALLLYYHAELENLLVLGTCNKTEKMVGFFVKYGDAAADIAPLESLYKMQVRELAAFLDIPEAIRLKPPSPDLLPGISDEYALGVDYATLDRILWRLEGGMGVEEVAAEVGVEPGLGRYVEELTLRSEHMRAPPSTVLLW